MKVCKKVHPVGLWLQNWCRRSSVEPHVDPSQDGLTYAQVYIYIFIQRHVCLFHAAQHGKHGVQGYTKISDLAEEARLGREVILVGNFCGGGFSRG